MLAFARSRRRRSVFLCRPFSLLLLLLSVLGSAPACKTAAPPAPPASPASASAPAGTPAPGTTTGELVLGPIDPAWVTSGGGLTPPRPGAPPRVVLELRLAPAARLIADANILGRKLPMRLGDLLIDSLTKMSDDDVFPINAELLAALAPDHPITLVIAFMKGGDHRGEECGAFPFARAADAASAARKLGAAVSDHPGAIERRSSAGDHLWMAVKDGVLLVSKTYEGMVATCAQALLASQGPAPAEDAVATVDVPALLARRGLKRDLETELGETLAKAADESAAKARSGGKSGGKDATVEPRLSRESMRRLGRRMGKALAESARARLAISASATDGLVLDATLEPRPGTALAQRSSAGVAYALDPALPIEDDRSLVLAWGSLGVFEPLLRAGLPADEKPAGQSMLDEFLATFTGGGSCVMENQGPVSTVCSLPLRAGVDARQALDRYAAFMRAMAKVNPPPGGRRFSPRIKKDILEFDWAIDLGAVAPEQAAMMRAYIGGDVTRYAVAVRGGRLLQFQGPTARARLLAWKDVAPGAPAPARPALLAETLARTRGASFMLWFDPVALLLRMLAHATDPNLRQARAMLSALPGLAAARTPVVVDAPAGAGFTAELRVPMATFDSVATLIGPFMGLMGR